MQYCTLAAVHCATYTLVPFFDLHFLHLNLQEAQASPEVAHHVEGAKAQGSPLQRPRPSRAPAAWPPGPTVHEGEPDRSDPRVFLGPRHGGSPEGTEGRAPKAEAVPRQAAPRGAPWSDVRIQTGPGAVPQTGPGAVPLTVRIPGEEAKRSGAEETFLVQRSAVSSPVLRGAGPPKSPVGTLAFVLLGNKFSHQLWR